jgi:post-segregation antitoxin (ccd killing protein)
MTKVRTTITISKDLLKKAREKEINISSFVDIELRRYLALIEERKTNDNFQPIKKSTINSIRQEVDSLSMNSKSI